MTENNTPSNAVRFKFIGDAPDQKYVRNFVVQATREEYDTMRKLPYPSEFLGVVVVSSNRHQPVGKEAFFVNPFRDMADTGWPTFVRTHKAT